MTLRLTTCAGSPGRERSHREALPDRPASPPGLPRSRPSVAQCPGVAPSPGLPRSHPSTCRVWCASPSVLLRSRPRGHDGLPHLTTPSRLPAASTQILAQSGSTSRAARCLPAWRPERTAATDRSGGVWVIRRLRNRWVRCECRRPAGGRARRGACVEYDGCDLASGRTGRGGHGASRAIGVVDA